MGTTMPLSPAWSSAPRNIFLAGISNAGEMNFSVTGLFPTLKEMEQYL